jgi:ribonuclease Z
VELYFLGTGAGLPSKDRNVTAIALLLYQERGTFWLIDCGEGTQHQMLASPLRPAKLEKIFITHLHGDHVYGLPGILSSRSFQSATTPVTIYGPIGIARMIQTVLETSSTHLPYPLLVEEIDEGIVFEDDTFCVSCRKLQHGILSFGYRFEEKQRSGKLLRSKLDALRIPAGPMFQKLKNGQDATLADGTLLRSKEFVGAKTKGCTIVICGDTIPCDATKVLARDADVMVHEATYREKDAQRARKHNHSTSKEAATIAASANVQALILTHISARYDKEACEGLESEAKSVFPNTQVASDYSQFAVKTAQARN